MSQTLSRDFKTSIWILLLFTLGHSSDAFRLLHAQSMAIPDELIPLLWLVLHVLKSLASMSDTSGARGLA